MKERNKLKILSGSRWVLGNVRLIRLSCTDSICVVEHFEWVGEEKDALFSLLTHFKQNC